MPLAIPARRLVVVMKHRTDALFGLPLFGALLDALVFLMNRVAAQHFHLSERRRIFVVDLVREEQIIGGPGDGGEQKDRDERALDDSADRPRHGYFNSTGGNLCRV